jgi:hypothetical protein
VDFEQNGKNSITSWNLESIQNFVSIGLNIQIKGFQLKSVSGFSSLVSRIGTTAKILASVVVR